MSRIDGKSAIVTGGSRGIGLAITRSLLERGARVLICATTQSGIDQTVGSLAGSYRDRVAGTVCDVRDYERARKLVLEAERRFGGLDILVNNAGIGKFGNVEKMSPADWRATIETNLSGVFYCCREAIPFMRLRGGGFIINIGSLAGKNAFAGGAAYNASKFGLVGFSEALMQEVRYNHIRVSCVMPGSVNTEFDKSAQNGVSMAWKLLPEDVAAVVINLLEMDPRALPSLVELRPSEPKK
ncbi:MAG TPA: SDR family oxidoreductase [Acidobacteriota bacterium]|nr:SDR family oxidoreductase [Acidobacteriota bacterium]